MGSQFPLAVVPQQMLGCLRSWGSDLCLRHGTRLLGMEALPLPCGGVWGSHISRGLCQGWKWVPCVCGVVLSLATLFWVTGHSPSWLPPCQHSQACCPSAHSLSFKQTISKSTVGWFGADILFLILPDSPLCLGSICKGSSLFSKLLQRHLGMTPHCCVSSSQVGLFFWKLGPANHCARLKTLTKERSVRSPIRSPSLEACAVLVHGMLWNVTFGCREGPWKFLLAKQVIGSHYIIK